VWLYTRVNDTTRLQHGDRSILEPDTLMMMLSKLSTDPSSKGFTTPLELCALICLNQDARIVLLSEIPMLDNINITT
jgi:hypothetical protein